MRFHVVSLPHTQTTTSFSACAYTAKVRGGGGGASSIYSGGAGGSGIVIVRYLT